MLRYRADRRTLLWSLLLAPSVVAVQYAKPELVPWLSWLSCYFALACGVIAHNHNHNPTFENKRLNDWFAGWISVLYGYPTFAWIPTHNLNHHKFVNRAGDATITWRYTKKHVLWMALAYFFVSSYWQSEPIKDFIAKAKAKNPKLHRRIMLQYGTWIGANLALLALAMGLHGARTGLYVWGFASAIPSLVSLFTIMLFNYDQHVNTDPWSRHNHSRSWEGKLLNFLLFNNGLHAAHHENAGTHWSELPAVHARIRPNIDPRLIEQSLWWYWFRVYFLAPFFPSLGTVQVGRAAWDAPDGRDVDITSAAVDAAEAGTNAKMVSAA
jgi:beta-carotene hydroxylase